MYFAFPVDHWEKIKENQKGDWFLNNAWEQKDAVVHEDDSDTNSNWHAENGPQKFVKETVLLTSTRILRIVLESWGDLLSFRIQWKAISWR